MGTKCNICDTVCTSKMDCAEQARKKRREEYRKQLQREKLLLDETMTVYNETHLKIFGKKFRFSAINFFHKNQANSDIFMNKNEKTYFCLFYHEKNILNINRIAAEELTRLQTHTHVNLLKRHQNHQQSLPIQIQLHHLLFLRHQK